MEVELRAGAKLNLLSPQEFNDGLAKHLEGGWAGEQEARGRGIKVLRFNGVTPSASSAVGQVIPSSPQQGYVWNIRLLNTQTTPAAIVRAWIATDNTGILPANDAPFISSSSSLFSTNAFGSGQVYLFPGEFVMISTNAAGGQIVGYRMIVIETPFELIWKTT
jgi:hypothetical protein